MFEFPQVTLGEEELALRAEVRQFLGEQRASGGYEPVADWA